MKPNRDFERMLEAYAAGDVADHERRLVERVLAGAEGDERQASAKEILEFEQALVKAIGDSVSVEGPDATADRVLARVYRRPEVSRGDFDGSAASKALRAARDRGAVTPSTERRRYYFQRPGFVRVAMLFIVVSGLGFFSWRDYQQSRIRNMTSGAELAGEESIGEVNYVSATADNSAAPKERGSRLVLPTEIRTTRDRVAVVRLGDRGMFVVKPQSVVKLQRSRRSGRLLVRIEHGGIRAKMRADHALDLQGEGLQRGQILGEFRGEGEIVRASDALGKNRSLVAPVFDEAFLVTVSNGRAVFRNQDRALRLGNGDLGVVGEATLKKLPRRDPVVMESQDQTWDLEGVVDRGAETAVRIGERVITRSMLAQEILRVYGDDLIEHIVKSRVIQAELGRLRLSVPPANHRIASAFVMNDDFMQVMPMRANFALQERAFHVAGLLTIEAKGSFPFREGAAGGQVGVVCERVWNRLQPNVKLRWQRKVNRQSAFRIDYRGMVINVGLAEAWDIIRRSVRAAEIERVVDDLIERQVIETWLRRNGESWPERGWMPDPDPIRRSAQNTLVRLTGLTLRQYFDRLRVQRAVFAFVPEASEAEVDRFLTEQMPDRGQVLFEHYFFAFVDRDQGFASHTGETARLESKRAADHVAERLRRGRMPQLVAPRELQPLIWRTSWQSGPRLWWDEVYGDEFRPSVLRLEDGEVSDPILGREGYHVVRMRRSAPTGATREQRVAAAQRLVKIERARNEIEALLEDSTTWRESVDELLR